MIGESIGNFEIVAQLGRGGMGEVWLAQQKSIKTRVAIKVLRAEVSEDKAHVDRFFNEALAVSKIRHAGVVKIFDCGYHVGRAYLVMELLEGETLRKRIGRAARLPLAEVCDIGRQIASVLDATHAAGVTHRDLKPDNVFLVPDAELASGERVKILDFGIAKLTGLVTVTSPAAAAMGTPQYMAPEQWKSAARADHRSDAYALGCVAFEMATGRPPFVAETIGEACSKHLDELPPAASSIGPGGAGLPAALDELIAGLLDKDPSRRPDLRTTMDAFAAIGGGPAPPRVPPPRTGLSTAEAVQLALDPTVPQQARTRPAIETTLGSATGSTTAVPPRRSRAVLIAAIGAAAVVAVVVAVVMLRRSPPPHVSSDVLRRISGGVPRVSSSVSIDVCIDETGGVTSVGGDLDAADRATVKDWLYLPYRRDGEAVAVCTTVELRGVQTLTAQVRDASGLPMGTRVVVAGRPRGEVTARNLEGKLVRLTLTLDADVAVHAGATLTRRAAGESYLELDPGPASAAPLGGAEIVNVVEPR